MNFTEIGAHAFLIGGFGLAIVAGPICLVWVIAHTIARLRRPSINPTDFALASTITLLGAALIVLPVTAVSLYGLKTPTMGFILVLIVTAAILLVYAGWQRVNRLWRFGH